MELTQLYQFKIAAELENMSKASEQLFVSQPALTKAIKKLEAELNVKLFERFGNKVVLNDNGRTVLKYTNEIFGVLEQMTNKLAIDNIETSVIRIAASVPSVLKDFTKIIQNIGYVEYSLQIMNHEQMKKALISGEIDLAISAEELKNENLYNLPLFDDRLAISAPISHPLAGKTEISLKEAAVYPLIGLSSEEDSYWMKMMLAYANKNNIKITYGKQVPMFIDVFSDKNLLTFESSKLFSVMPTHEGRVNIPITDIELRLQYVFVYKKNNFNKVKHIIAFIKNNYKDIVANKTIIYDEHTSD